MVTETSMTTDTELEAFHRQAAKVRPIAHRVFNSDQRLTITEFVFAAEKLASELAERRRRKT